MKINLNKFIIFIIIICFCTTRFWGINIEWYINLSIRIIAILFLILSNGFKLKFSKEASGFAKITALPIFLIMVYSCINWFIISGVPEADVIRNLFTSSSYLFIDILLAVLFYSKYKGESVDLFVKCGFISYIIGSIVPLLVKFPSNSLLYLITSYSDNYDLLYLTEVNDLTFGMGFCLLYYLFFDNREKTKRRFNIILCILLIFWGLKRVEILALVLCYVFYRFVMKKNHIKKATAIATCIVLVASYSYVMFIHNSELISLANKYNINFMGRLTTYQYVANNYSSFNLTYLGIGFGHIDEILDDLVRINYRVGYIPVISLHSDILRMYLGIGFIGFGLWILYQMSIKTKILYKKNGENAAKAYLLFTIFLFILYLTDNTYSYPVTFTLYLICTLAATKINDNAEKKDDVYEE